MAGVVEALGIEATGGRFTPLSDPNEALVGRAYSLVSVWDQSAPGSMHSSVKGTGRIMTLWEG